MKERREEQRKEGREGGRKAGRKKRRKGGSEGGKKGRGPDFFFLALKTLWFSLALGFHVDTPLC
jgi:hypothetical protein